MYQSMEMRRKYIDTKRMPLRELIELRREEYGRTKNVYSKFMGEIVYFNNKGFFHATHDGRGKIRSELDQRMRLNLLPDIGDVIKNASSYGAPPRMIPKNDKRNTEGKDIIFYELFYRFNSRKAVSVIIRKIGNGQLHYYSVRYAKVSATKKNP